MFELLSPTNFVSKLRGSGFLSTFVLACIAVGVGQILAYYLFALQHIPAFLFTP
jgi:hypothetical protein